MCVRSVLVVTDGGGAGKDCDPRRADSVAEQDHRREGSGKQGEGCIQMCRFHCFLFFSVCENVLGFSKKTQITSTVG